MQTREQELQKQALSAQAQASQLEQQLAQQAETLKRQEQEMQFLQRVCSNAQPVKSTYFTHAGLTLAGQVDTLNSLIMPGDGLSRCSRAFLLLCRSAWRQQDQRLWALLLGSFLLAPLPLP